MHVSVERKRSRVSSSTQGVCVAVPDSQGVCFIHLLGRGVWRILFRLPPLLGQIGAECDWSPKDGDRICFLCFASPAPVWP